MKVGDKASVTRSFDQDALAAFFSLARDAPRADYVPEPLISGLISYVLGVKLPGSGTNYLKQETKFLAPAPIAEPITATVEITRLRPDKHLCDLSTTCTDSAGNVICTGRALVLVKDVANPIEA
jgi:3-hydroxybutyryl-CoA dehydratase